MFIYLIANRITGKYYVGQHKGTNLKKYLQQKLSHAKRGESERSHLYASMRKHGRDAFTIHALLSDVQTRPELDAYEKDFIAFLRSQDPEYGYNICRGGEGFTGPHTSKAKVKVTEALKQRWAQPSFREHWTELMTGHDVAPETVEKIKIARAKQDESHRLSGWNMNKGNAGNLSHKAHVLGGKAGSREDKQKAGQLGAERGSVKARHVRWHVNRGQVNSECPLCPHSSD